MHLVDPDAIRREPPGLIDRVPAIVYIDVLDPDASVGHRTTFLSRGVETLVGYTVEEIVDGPDQWLGIVHPDDRADLIARTVWHLRHPSRLSSEYRVIHRGGRVLTVRDDCISIADPTTGQIVSHGVITDVSALREAEERFRAFIERLPIVSYIESSDFDLPFVYVSPQIEALTGYSAAEFYADDRLYEHIVHPDDRQHQLEGYGETLQPYLAEYRLIHRDGRIVWVRDQARMEPDADGGLAAIHGFLIDITTEKKGAFALAAAEERYRTLIERLPLVTFMDSIDAANGADQQTIYMSPQVETLLGVPPEAFIADRTLWRRMMHPDDIEHAYDPRDPYEERAREYRMITADGRTIWVRSASSAVANDDGVTAFRQGYVVDVSAAKQADEAVGRAQKLESLGTLAGGIAHDFNNLLVSILGNAELATMELAPDAPARASIEQIEVASRRAADLARQLLAYAGRGQFVVQPTSVNDLIEEIVDLLRVAIGKGIALSLRLADDLPPVEADATQLRQVVMNIVINASDAIGTDSGAIAVSTSVGEIDDAVTADLYGDASLSPGRYVAIEIADTGPGMDHATVRRIFDPFFTTKFAGRGLGLAAVLGIVRGHHGGIEVDTKPGGGTRFRIYLPPTTGTVPAAATQPPIARGQHRTILIVDDEPAVRAVAERMLQRAGYETVTAVDGRDAVERIRALVRSDVAPGRPPRETEPSVPAIHAVLLDVTMPILDGEGTLQAIRELDPGLPVVLMSGYSEIDTAQRLGSLGPTAFIQKPFTPADLSRVIRTALERPDQPEA